MRNYKMEFDHQLRIKKELEAMIPETISGFVKMERNHSMDGALTVKTKELIALGISVNSQCDGCMITHLHHALEAGADRAEILEVLSVSVMMGGAPALNKSGIVLEALDQYEAEKSPAHLFDPVDTVESWGWS